jgi:hypothetical protein
VRALILPYAVFDGWPLLGIEFFEMGDGHGFRISVAEAASMNMSLVVVATHSPLPSLPLSLHFDRDANWLLSTKEQIANSISAERIPIGHE